MDANLYELIRGRRHYLNANLIRSYMFQLVRALHHMHRKGIFHRDIKPENILIENTSEMGRGLKLADFGSCRGIYSKQPYTEYISTRWYRAPECLLTDGYYGPEMVSLVWKHPHGRARRARPRRGTSWLAHWLLASCVPTTHPTTHLRLTGPLGCWVRLLRDYEPIPALPWYE